MGALVAVLSRKNENATQMVLTMLETLKPRNTECFGIASPTTIRTGETLETLRRQAIHSTTVIGHAFSRIRNTDRPQPIGLRNAALIFEGRIYPPGRRMCDAVVVAKEMQLGHEGAARRLLDRANGDFAFVVAEASGFLAGRDSLGVRPFYYGENPDVMAVASERKALWTIGIGIARSFPPGHIVRVRKNGFEFTCVKSLTYLRQRKITMRSATRKLQESLECSVAERIFGVKEVAVAFSGGLDSTILAYLSKKSNKKTRLVHVSMKGQPETEHAKKVAKDLKLPIHIYLLEEKDIEQVIPTVVRLIEEPDPIKVSIGIPVYWISEKTAELGLRVLLAGQGADELFGGYRRYVNEFMQDGEKAAARMMLDDIIGIHETNLERDSKICNFNGVELRLPFMTWEIAELASRMPLTLKIEPRQNTLRKLVLRQAAKNMGLPEYVIRRPKKAIQYATGISDALKRLAKKEYLTASEYLERLFRKMM